MSLEHTFYLIYFFVFAVINLVFYLKLSKYWYMSAGVTKKDVALYMSEHISRHRYRYLIRWLREKAKDKKRFNIMLFILIAAGFFVLPFPSFAYTEIWMGNITAVKVMMTAEAVGTILIAVLGFSYGRKIEAETDGYYESSQYKPYEGENAPEHIEDLDEIYDDSEEKTQYSGLDDYETEQREKKKFVMGYLQKLFIVVMALFFLFSPILLKDFNFKTFSFEKPGEQIETDSGNNESDTYPFDLSRPDMSIYIIRETLIQEGYSPEDNLEKASEKYPDFIIEDSLVVNDLEIHFEYFQLVNSDQAHDLKEQIQKEIKEKYSTGTDKDIESDTYKGKFTVYTLETEDYYAAAIWEGEGVLYARCDKVSATWMKMFLYNLGYLETF